MPLVERMEVFTVPEPMSGCWLWIGSVNSNGYGTCRTGPTVDMVHRVVWAMSNGPIPDGGQVDHTCSVRPCVNPDHLELTTASENSRRKFARIRSGRGNVRMARTASLQIKHTKSGDARYKVRFRDRIGSKVVDRSRTFGVESDALAFMASIDDRPIYDLIR